MITTKLLRYKHKPTGLYYKSIDRKPRGINLGDTGEMYWRSLPFPLLEVLVIQENPEQIITTQKEDWEVEEYEVVLKQTLELADSTYFLPSGNMNFNRYSIGARVKKQKRLQRTHGGVKGVKDGEEHIFENLQQAADWLNRFTGTAHKGTIQKAIVGNKPTKDGTEWSYLPPVTNQK